ncbi:hypothetical protein QVD17_36712 [Tagetes erecta]|uniref:Uncharacterized protein n=1 Tax=Tagetes erecta TaxID=13708 RepID=A0AAD8NIJ0_TARER|nr:hypothetical protein QVD17_36712 [Tagetes erecta]
MFVIPRIEQCTLLGRCFKFTSFNFILIIACGRINGLGDSHWEGRRRLSLWWPARKQELNRKEMEGSNKVYMLHRKLYKNVREVEVSRNCWECAEHAIQVMLFLLHCLSHAAGAGAG